MSAKSVSRPRARRLRLPAALLSAAIATVFVTPAHAQTTTIAITGTAAPAPLAGAKFSTFGGPMLNNAGQVGFFGTLQTGVGGVTTSNDTALFAGAPGALGLAAREGSAAPGAGAGAVFSSFSDIRFNGLGQLAFTGSLVVGTGGVTSSNDHGIWAGGAGAVQLVAREGSAAPGVSGATFNPNFEPPFQNDTGETGFIGVLNSAIPARSASPSARLTSLDSSQTTMAERSSWCLTRWG